MIFLYIILIIYIILVFYNKIKLQNYNKNGIILQIEDINDVSKQLNTLHPMVTSDIFFITIDDLLNIKSSYIIKDSDNFISLKSFKEENQIYIYKNKNIICDFEIIQKINFPFKIFNDYNYLFPIKYSMSLFKGNINTTLTYANHNYNIIGILDGESTFYLFNPKHKKDIINKNLNEIKKWAHKITLSKSFIILIPTNWYFIQEINTNCIQYHIDIDTYFTFIPNILLN
tara:strand:- start:1265 stop:1951 length:687 start_codon:yes stop_codon:yes gene_type:complete